MKTRIFAACVVFAGLVLAPGLHVRASSCLPGIPCTSYTKGSGANAGKADSPTCDGDFMNQIYARATLEAQRENVINQGTLTKPDSVLEYTCFDAFMNHAVANAPPLFSESTAWANKNVPLNIRYAAAANGQPQNNPSQVRLAVNMGGGHITSPMASVVGASLANYINGSFGHTFLGGLVSMDYTPSSGTSYSCQNMQSVFQLAKCENLPATPFPTFTDLVGGFNPRTLPVACPTGTFTSALVTTAQNPAPGYPAARADALLSYWDMFEIDNTQTDKCPAPPIPTGLRITYTRATQAPVVPATNPSGVTITSAPVDEYICSNPGCWYSQATGDCEM